MRHLQKTLCLTLLFLIHAVVGTQASQPQPQPPPKGMMMLTIFLRHDQSKTLDEINQHLKQTGFDQKFPPAEAEVVSGT